MRDNWFDSQQRQTKAPNGSWQPDVIRLLGAGAVVALALAFASTVEAPFVAAMFSELLMFGALGFLVAAMYRRESAGADHVTAWDQAALLLLASLIGGLFVDPAALQQALVERGLIEAPAAGAQEAIGNATGGAAN